MSSREVVEITDAGKRKGKRICFDCGIDYLYARGDATDKKPGAVQSIGQRRLKLKGSNDVDRRN